jgi:hypothetical protein
MMRTAGQKILQGSTGRVATREGIVGGRVIGDGISLWTLSEGEMNVETQFGGCAEPAWKKMPRMSRSKRTVSKTKTVRKMRMVSKTRTTGKSKMRTQRGNERILMRRKKRDTTKTEEKVERDISMDEV